MKQRIEHLIRLLRSQLPERDMLTLFNNGEKIRVNEFNPQYANVARNDKGNVVMVTGSFGIRTLDLIKICRSFPSRTSYSWDQAVWFILEPNAVIPQHFDDDYGDYNNRARYHYTECVAGECSFQINQTVIRDWVLFNPGTDWHGATAGPDGAVILQLPLKERDANT